MKRTKGSQSEMGMWYQYGVTTLLAAELSRNNQVDDYVIYSSENSAGKFDDVVGRIKLKDKDHWYLCLIQVKYKETKKLNVSDNLRGKTIEYFLSDYIHCFNEILSNTELTCRQGIPPDNVRFAIFCDKGIQMPVFLRQDCTFQLNACRYNDNSNVTNNILLPFDDKYWKFICKDLQNSEYQHFFDRCYLYLEQPSYNKLNKQIEKACAIGNAKNIINYVKDYFNDDYLYKQGLRREVFEVELQSIRNCEAIPPLVSFEELVDDGRVDIFNEIILQHDITAINCMQGFAIEPCLYSCLAHRINTVLNVNIDWEMYISKQKYLDDDIIRKFVRYSDTKKVRYWMDPPHTLKLLMLELWKCGDLPLILTTQTKLNDFERYRHLKRSYIIIDDWSNRREEVSASKLNVFSCLSSIINFDLQDMILKNTFVSLQGRQPITLKDLLVDDKVLMSTFTSANLLEMMRKRAPFVKEDYYKGSNYLAFIVEDDECTKISDFIEPYLIGHNITISCPPGQTDECLKVIEAHAGIAENYTIYHLRRIGKKLGLTKGDPDKLSHCFVDQYGEPLYNSIKGHLIPIIGQPTALNELQYIPRQLRGPTVPIYFLDSQNETRICLLSGDVGLIGQKVQFSSVDHITREITSAHKKTYFLKIDEMENPQHSWRQLCGLGYPVFDIYIKDGRLNLLRFQHCKNFETYISYDGLKYTENDFFDEIKGRTDEIAVVTGDAGIGKTSFLKWLCNKYFTENYIVFYDLINLQVDQNKSESQGIDLMSFVLKRTQQSLPKKHINFVSKLWTRNRLIWVLDSFDEIRLACEKQVLDFIRFIANYGTQIIIGTRIENCKILMRKFGVRLIKIEPLDEKQYSLYWQLNKDVLNNLPSELLTNPLYLNFLKMICVNQEQLLNITKFSLYEKVINLKIRRCLRRTYRILYDSEVERTVSIFEQLALVAMFGREIIEQELYWKCDTEVSDMTKVGIVVDFDEDACPVFYHRSFVEFLVARWMAKAHQIRVYKSAARYVYKQIFHENKLHILDILFEDVDLHKAIIEADIFRIKVIMEMNGNCLDTVDKLGRTALHAAIISCGYSRCLLKAFDILEMIISSMLEGHFCIDKTDFIMDWNWSEYVQPETFEIFCAFNQWEVVKIYLQLQRRKVEKQNCSIIIFPTKWFNILLLNAIFTSMPITWIADLVFLQNYGNKIFRSLYQACLKLVPQRIFAWTKDFRFDGQLTPIHIASIYGNVAIIQHLIEIGADVNAIDAFGYTALNYSIMRCYMYGSEGVVPINGRTICKSNKNEDVVNFLLQADAFPEPIILPVNALTPLVLAIQTMNVNVVRMLLEAGANICRRIKDNDTPLHIAAKVGCLDIVRCLLEYKAPQHLKNKRGETPMDIAVKENHAKVITELSENKDTEDVDVEEERAVYLNKSYQILKGTPLHDAAYFGNMELVRALLSEGRDLNLQNKNGFTPFHVALYENNTEVITYMLNNRASVDVQDKYGYAPLLIGVLNNNTIVMQILLEMGANPNIGGLLGETPLFIATSNRNLDTVKLLLRSGARVNVGRMDGVTPLDLSAKRGYEDIVRILLENGADTNTSNEYGMTSLLCSLSATHNKISELLLRKTANTNVRSKHGATPLFVAVLKENIDIIPLLLEYGARIDDVQMDGNTVLHQAAHMGSDKIVRLLLEKGANINAKNNNGDSVLFVAARAGQVNIVVLLLKANISVDREGGDCALILAADMGDINTVRLLLNKGVSVNAVSNGYSPLHLAAAKGYVVIVDLLLKQGANVNAICKLGFTSLDFAHLNRHDNVVKLLEDKGADIHAKRKDDNTPYLSVIETRNILENAVEILLHKNVNIDHRDGVAALRLAARMGLTNIVKLLQNRGIHY